MMELDVESILSELGIDYQVEGNKKSLKGVASIYDAKEDQLSFCWYDGKKASSLILESRAGAILCKRGIDRIIATESAKQLFFVDNPRLAFVQIVNRIFRPSRMHGISSTAKLSPSANIDDDCYIGDQVIIGQNCKIGKNTVIYDRVTIMQDTVVGDNCIIQPGVVIGGDGFAYERHDDGRLEKFPHIKGVNIGNAVEIGANSFVARGSLTDTVIGDGTKIDALVHIPHNAKIGQNCELIAGTIIGGSDIIGNTCWIGMNSTIKDNIQIGNNVIVAAGAVVIHQVGDEDVVAGVPAKSIKDKVTSNMLFLMAGQTSTHGNNV